MPTTRSSLIPIGEEAPDFVATATDNQTIALSALRGKKRVVLVFYPGDNTPVCTSQLCAFRDEWAELQDLEAVIFGTNPASVDIHTRFAARYKFPFPLLADVGGHIAGAYGCKMFFGIIRRTVYVIDRQGRIAYAQRGNPSPSEIINVLRTLEDLT